MLSELTCDVCGGELVKISQTEYQCKCCKTKMQFSEDYISNVSLYQIALNHRLCHDFDLAASAYNQILKNATTSYEANFGLLLCEYGLEFEMEYDKCIPIFHLVSRRSMLSDEHYLAALSSANSVQNEELKRLIGLAEQVRQQIIEKIDSNQNKYDIFLCQKINNIGGEGRAKEYEFSLRLMRLLEKRYGDGRIFLSEVSLGGGVKSDAEIFDALYRSKAMIVISSSIENTMSTWVKSEWTRYLNMIKEGMKGTGTLLPIALSGATASFGGKLARLQALEISDPEYMNILYDRLDEILVGSVNCDKLYLQAERKFAEKDYTETIKLCDRIIASGTGYHNAYWLKLLSEYTCANSEQLIEKRVDISKNTNYQNAVKFAPMSIASERQLIANRIFRALIDAETEKQQEIANKIKEAKDSESSTSSKVSQGTLDFDPPKEETQPLGFFGSIASKAKQGIFGIVRNVSDSLNDAFNLGATITVVGNVLKKCSRAEDGTFLVPSEVTRISVAAFEKTKRLEIVKIHRNVSVIDFGAFKECKEIKRIEVEDGNPYYRSVDGLLYCGSNLICCPRARSGNIYLPKGTTVIDSMAFYKCRQVTSVNIPDSVAFIDANAFFKAATFDRKTERRIKEIKKLNR